ncbi:MAG: FAD-dependent oxidoreductase, partial [bacterium]|nr:FAD-dependent oxidoreductase [bacterium]
MPSHTDIAIVGAGIVGCATAQHLRRTFPNRSLTVFERRKAPGLETSAASSGVIHSGLHLDPTSLKARLAQRGRALVLDACARYDVRMNHCGMHVVVSPRDALHLIGEVSALRDLLRRALAQGIEATIISPWRVRRNEPAVHALLGIQIPDVTVIDVPTLVHALATDAAEHGTTFRYRTAVEGI